MANIQEVSNEELLSQLSNEELLSLIREKPEIQVGKTPKEMLAGVRAAGQKPMSDVASEAMDMSATSAGNIPGSFGKLVSGAYDAITHPVQTAQGLGTLAAGAIDAGARGLESMVTGGNQAQSQPGWDRARSAWEGTKDFYAGRYGSFDATRKTMMSDPVGVMADASALLGAGAGVLKAAGANTSAQSAMNASRSIDPFNLAVKGATQAGKMAGGAYNYIAGTSSTVGKTGMDEAMKGSRSFIDAKSGKITDEMVVKDARNALDVISENRNTEFAKSLPALQSVKENLDVTPVNNVVKEWTSKFGGTLDDTGNPVFTGSGSRITGQTANEIDSIIGEMRKTTSYTPNDLDALRQRIGQLTIETPRAAKFAADVAEKIKEVIEPAVPGYANTLQKYAKTSDMLKEMRTALSLGDQRTIDTAITKLINSIRHDKAFRTTLMKELDSQTNGDLIAKVSGRAASPALSGRLGTMATALTAGGGLAYLTGNPGLLAIIGLASPKVASWGATQLGRIGRATEKVALGPVAKGGLVVQQLGQLAAQDIENERNRNK